ncbi:hypothetical protein D9756_009148 [Leucocoprinus leucothites]|uniref:Peptidase M48 domain-containing protein n=1 Tax=Leucocoprinus leucothites TaxID=201217 RepID=A0A8H5FUY7_9AGAR|nr:hypothetical protein D9756_009148 [Leucoagaricus leucothites]
MFRTLFTRPTFSRCLKQTPKLQTRGLRTTMRRPNQYKRFSDQGSGGAPSNRLLNWRQWDPPKKFGALMIVGGGIYYVAHLEQVPETGRWRFMNTSMQREAQIGKMMNSQMKQDFHDRILPPNHPLSRHVRKVTSRILLHSNLGHIKGESPSPNVIERLFSGVWTPEDDYAVNARDTYGSDKEWDVIVVNDKRIINAAAVPGLITVFTGILPVCRDEQGLAAVLSHEIGHVVARHSAERMSSQTVTFALLFVLHFFGLDYFFTNAFQTIFFQLPNSRAQELEADLIGLRLMARACYDPKAAPEMFERMSKLGDRKIDFFDTHPSSERRIKKLEEALPEAYTILARNPQCETMREQLERFREVSIKDDASLEFS